MERLDNSKATKTVDRELTRRDFLKISGKGIAGITVSSALLSLIGCKSSSVANGDVRLWAVPSGVLVAERARCTGCQRCEQSCTLLNGSKGAAYVSRVRLRPHFFFGDGGVGSGGGLYYDLNFTPITCRQCKDPACGNACPVKAIYADARSGARVVDEAKCVGCGACVSACPWHVPVVDLETRKSTKCITCGECARNCPTGALKVIPWKEITV
jgi:Fe-S-cluster-containing dehydrogenase component